MKKLMANKIIKYAVILLIVAGLGMGAFFAYRGVTAANVQNGSKEMTARVERGDIDITISGTGTVQPIARYDIVPLVKGVILSAPFEEGMSVKAGDLLYKIDDSDLSYNIQKAENSIEKLKINNQDAVESLKNLKVYAPFDGRVINLNLKEGEQVGNNAKIADIVDDKRMMAAIPYNKPQIDKIKVGQKAQLQVLNDWLTMDGFVNYVSSTESYTSEGAKVYNAEIVVENIGMGAGTEVKGTVKTPDGDITSYFTGKLGYFKEQPIVAGVAGKVKKIYIKNNEWAKAGQIILELENDSLNDTIYKNSLDLKDSQLSLEAQKKQLKDYNILSPIDGTVIKKYYKAGDTINNTNDSKVLMTVADMSKMVFTMDIDELDIAKVAVGQKVSITADALPGAAFEGEVTNVSLEGKTQNGVTTYPIQVTIPKPEKLRPGMNVNAKIMVESKKDVLYVPVAAVTKIGDKAYVFVKGNGTGAESKKKDTAVQKEASSEVQGSSLKDRQSSQRGTTGNAQNFSQRTGRSSTGVAGSTASGNGNRQRREVVVGISNDNYIEIVSGLKEGEIVYLPSVSTNSGTNNSWNRNNRMGIPPGDMVRIRP